MPLREAAPAFLWAGVVVGVTSAVLAVAWYQVEIELLVDNVTESVRIEQ